MDKQVGVVLKELEEAGYSENTIIFYYGDHGGGMARGKRSILESVTRVPLIMRFPKKWQHLAPANPGEKTDRLVSFVDFPATVMSLIGVPIPEYMDGEPFAGEQPTKPCEHVYLYRGRMDAQYDEIRAIRDKKFRYVRNYTPYRSYGQYYTFAEHSRTTPAWRQAYLDGKCNKAQSIYWEWKPGEEFYEVDSDPHEVNNLIDDPKFADQIKKMRKVLDKEMLRTRDVGPIPESMYVPLANGGTVYDYAQTEAYKIKVIKKIADLACARDEKNLPKLIKAMADDNPVVRWGVAGAVNLKGKAMPAKAVILEKLKDPQADVRILAAESIAYLGDPELAVEVLGKELVYKEGKPKEQYNYAANALQCIDMKYVKVLKPQLDKIKKDKKYGYATRTIQTLANIQLK